MIVLLVAVFVSATGGGIFWGLVVLVMLEVIVILALTAWCGIGKPVGHKVREEGLVGIGGYVYRRVIAPILYGSRGKQ